MGVELEVGKTVVNIDVIDDDTSELVGKLSVEKLVKLVNGCVGDGVTSTVDIVDTLEVFIIDIELTDLELFDELTVEAVLVDDCVVIGVATAVFILVDVTGGPKLKSKSMMVSEKGSLANWVSTSLP